MGLGIRLLRGAGYVQLALRMRGYELQLATI